MSGKKEIIINRLPGLSIIKLFGCYNGKNNGKITVIFGKITVICDGWIRNC